MFKKVTIWIMMLTVSVGMLTGCGGRDTTQAEATASSKETAGTTAASTTAETTAETTAAADLEAKKAEIKARLMAEAEAVRVNEDSVTFEDESGRGELTIPKKPQKVAVLYGSHACLWTEAGGTVSIGIGGKNAVALYKEQIGRNILEDGVIVVSETSSAKNWNVEAILAEQPDLIVCSTAMSGYSTISAPAEAANIPVIALTYNGVSGYLKWFKVFANLNGKPELWKDIAEKTADEIVEIIAKVPEGEAPRVLPIMASSKGVMGNLKNSNMGLIIEDLKAVNLADVSDAESSKSRVSMDLESIFAANPEMIFVQGTISEADAKEKLDAFVDGNPVWEELSAVKNDKVYYMPKALFHYRPNHKYDEAYRMMASYLYPGVDF